MPSRVYFTALTKDTSKELIELGKTIKLENNEKSTGFLEKLKDMRSMLKTEKAAQNGEYHKRVYEGFFVVGPEYEELKRLEVNEVRHVKSERIFEYPSGVSEIAR
eukprot:TRINITY_DN2663_c0_g1_i8.p3 TRINITY_DN2663_c0_g1~~TRINITY_DN2663_c0_g1_i8.p3  ORF type:complete len:105 (+),score=23.93 TRINITY_DN2663_c0_g1_i8:823-1137(+)